MRQQANKHILERDLSNPHPVLDVNGHLPGYCKL